jgi:hypothetical protein
MPFIMQQQLHIWSAIMRQRFCSMAQAISSSHLQWIFIPPAHFSIFIVQRGTMHMFAEFGIPIGIPMPGIADPLGMPIEAIEPIIAPRSIIITLDILSSFFTPSWTTRNLAAATKKKTLRYPLAFDLCAAPLRVSPVETARRPSWKPPASGSALMN